MTSLSYTPQQLKGLGFKNLKNYFIVRNLVDQYFNAHLGAKIDTENLFAKNEGGLIRILSLDGKKGIIITSELQLDRDHEERMKLEKAACKDIHKRFISYHFVDNSEGLSGFLWEDNN
jgi:hypothetical protein